MDQFTESLAEGLRRFAMAGVGAVSLTIEKSKEIIDHLVERGEVTAAEGQNACEDLQKKMAAQFDAFSKKLKSDYEAASFEEMLERCDSLNDEQKARLMEKLTTPSAPEQTETTEPESAQCETPEESDASSSDDHISL